MRKEKEQIVIIGLGQFGMSIARELSNYDVEVMAVDSNGEAVDEVSKYVTHAVKADACDVEILKKLGITEFDVAIIGVGENLEASIMIALTLKELNVPYIVAKSKDEKHTKLLSMIGVDKIIDPEREAGTRTAKGIMHKSIIERVEFGKEYSVVEIEAPKEWVNLALSKLIIRQKYNISIVCVEKNNGKIIIPNAEYVIEEKDNLMLISPNTELESDGYLGKIL